ncbi:MAG: DUF4064 domain-containing protein [Bacillus sp. (in: firmicutes)]
MKRTGEIVLGVIGVILSALFFIGGICVIALQYNEKLQGELTKTLEEAGTSSTEIQVFFDAIASGGWIISIAAFLTVILGIIAIVCVKKNRKPKVAGVLFILSTLLIVIPTFGVGFLPAALFLIAGIMSFVRKPKDSFHANSSF